MAAPPYKLSCSIYGHNGDVRAVAVTEDGKIVSGSRDMTAKLWAPNESGAGYRECLTMTSHKNFVSCVCALPPSKNFSQGLIITGSNDNAIRLFDKSQTEPFQVLNGHTDTVCKIVYGIDDTILSSSWDKTFRKWSLNSFQCASVFSGHEAAVWAAVQMPCGVMASGSADKKIKIWIENGSCLKTLSGHKDCVRDLAVAGPKEILSCSNDGTVMHWHITTGVEIESVEFPIFNTKYETELIISLLGPLNFLTCSEDHTVKLWNNGQVVETIPVPATSVWSVAALPNGDIVTGSSDGVVRVFSADASRQATPEELKSYEEQLVNAENVPADVGGVKVSELPGEEALFEPGSRDGQIRLVRTGDAAMAYGWSSSEGKWNLIGNVTESPEAEGVSPSGRPTYNGVEYDYVFNVDIESGKPLLKLPYNKTDDPWHAAQKFIHDNELSQNFLDEVANFIIKNSQQDSFEINSSSEFVDPFTGAARYIPSNMNAGPNGLNTANQSQFSSGPRNQNFKGANDFLSNSYFPQREFLRFDQANLNVILEKLLEFNKKMGEGIAALSENEIVEMVKICESGAHCRIEDLETLTRLLKWPEEIVFPVLDVMRLAIRNKEANNYLCNERLIPELMKFLSPESTVSSNTMLALRVLTNMMSGEAGQTLADNNKKKLLGIIENIPPPYSKPVQIAMSTLLLNMAVLIRRSETPVGRSEALAVTQRIFPKLSDQEALLRAFVALGTLLVDMVDSKTHLNDFTPILLKYQNDSSFGAKVQECCQYILKVLQ